MKSVPPTWTWAGASTRGTSHLLSGTPKQDAAAFAEYSSARIPVAVAVVCDGAGSAKHSEVGARVACLHAHRLVRTHLEKHFLVSSIDKSLAESWLSNIRRQLERVALAAQEPLKEYATTITIVVSDEKATRVIAVGDSPCVINCGNSWMVPIWPMRGEYANQTYFLTQDPIPVWSVEAVNGPVEKFAVFSDGIDKLVLRDRQRKVFTPFFDGLFDGLASGAGIGRDRVCSESINRFLASDRVNAFTDDDKTIIIARRSHRVSLVK